MEGVLVGAAVGVVITCYRFVLSHMEAFLRSVIVGSVNKMLGPFLGALLVAAAFCAIGYVVSKVVDWEKDTAGSGIPQIDAEVMGRLDMNWYRVLGAKFLEGSLVVASGLSMGREGPSVQLGGMVGKGVSRSFGKERGEERLLVTCGAAAGMSAAFHAPLTGILFAIEEIHREFNAPLVLSVMASTITADFVTSQVLGVAPVVRLALGADLPHGTYLLVCLMGVVMGFVGAAHNRGMFFCQERVFGRFSELPRWASYVVPFALSGVMAFVAPDLLCGGDAIIEKLVEPEGLALTSVLLFLLGKYFFTTVCFSAGVPGGTLLPMVVMGGLFGLGFGDVCLLLGLINANQLLNFVVLGIAGSFAAVVRAPVTAVVLSYELTGSLDALLSVSLVSILAYVVANFTKTDPFYEHLLGKLVGVTIDDQDVNETSSRLLHSYHVAAGSMAEGKKVAEVPWPNGSLVVNITRADHSLIPKGSVELMALDEILVVMNEDTEFDTDLIIKTLCKGGVTG